MTVTSERKAEIERRSRAAATRLAAGEAQEALQDLEELLMMAPTYADLWYCHAAALLQLGRVSDGERSLNRCFSLDPDHGGGKKLHEQIQALQTGTGFIGHEASLHFSVPRIREIYEREGWIEAARYVRELGGAGEVIELSFLEHDATVAAPTVTRITDVQIAGPNALLLTHDGRVLRETAVYSHVGEALEPLQGLDLAVPLSHRHEESFVPLCGIWSEGFWHWMMEYLVAALMAELSGFKGKYLIRPHSPAFVLESLQLLGIDASRVEEFNLGWWWVAEAWLPQLIPAGRELREYPGIIRTFRNRILAAVGVSTAQTPHRRVYISRKKARNKRAVVNEAELLELLGRFNFESVVLEDLSLRDQIVLMSTAEILVAPHGAGTLHCTFMPERTTVIELFSPKFVNPCMMNVSRLLHQDHHMVVSKSDSPEYQHGNEVLAFLDYIEALLVAHCDQQS